MKLFATFVSMLGVSAMPAAGILGEAGGFDLSNPMSLFVMKDLFGTEFKDLLMLSSMGGGNMDFANMMPYLLMEQGATSSTKDSLFELMLMSGADLSDPNSMASFLPLFLEDDGPSGSSDKLDKMLPWLMMNQGGSDLSSNPMLMMSILGKDSSMKDMLPFMMMNGGMEKMDPMMMYYLMQENKATAAAASDAAATTTT